MTAHLHSRHYLLLSLFILLMALTRNHHFASATHLPDASWALFYLAGFFLPSVLGFWILLPLAAAVDYAAIAWFGVNDYCISSAYGFLIPAYASLWLAGQWYAQQHRWQISTLAPWFGSVLLGAAACEWISSGSFYLTRPVEGNLMEFVPVFAYYFPKSLETLAIYLTPAALLYWGIHSTRETPSAARSALSMGSKH